MEREILDNSADFLGTETMVAGGRLVTLSYQEYCVFTLRVSFAFLTKNTYLQYAIIK